MVCRQDRRMGGRSEEPGWPFTEAERKRGIAAEEELLEDTWMSGVEGTYTADDLAEGRIPEGYGPGDLRLHRLPPVREGTYYLAELRTPDHFSAMEPQKIEIGKDSGGIIRAVNRLSRGRIEILKLDAQWHEKPLPGAWFEVKNVKTRGAFPYGDRQRWESGIRRTSGGISGR